VLEATLSKDSARAERSMLFPGDSPDDQVKDTKSCEGAETKSEGQSEDYG